MANLNLYGRNEAAIVARAAQVPLADYDGGCNLGASNAPGIGIGGGPNPKLDDWTSNDQHGQGRVPQDTQHIGGNGIEEGTDSPTAVYPIKSAIYDVTPGVDDLNNTQHFIEATQNAAPGGSLGGGYVNYSDYDVEIGDRIWCMNEL